MSYRVRILGAADGRPTPHDGRYLIAWNPHTPYGLLALDSTADPAAARRFSDLPQVFREYRTVSQMQPWRPDGKPNRPLRAVSLEIEPAA